MGLDISDMQTSSITKNLAQGGFNCSQLLLKISCHEDIDGLKIKTNKKRLLT